MKMRELPGGERPREKLWERGAPALSNGELLAILLRSGTRSESVLDLAQRLLSAAGGSLTRLSTLSAEALCRLPGIKKDKSASVRAAFELGRRLMAEASAPAGQPVLSARSVYEQMLPVLKGRQCEECWVLFLNHARLVTGRERISEGGLTATTVDCRPILRRALEQGATALILVHNHPASNPEPSKEDVAVTQALRKAASAFDIVLLDHVVVSDDSFYSFRDERVFFR
ncbi:MAG: DNA repair protein RadC [Bacteroidales bacterium]|nr:DNA repair protein RadC [Bacteroidales bacterium]